MIFKFNLAAWSLIALLLLAGCHHHYKHHKKHDPHPPQHETHPEHERK